MAQKQVKLPDGTTLQFPDDATDEEIDAIVNEHDAASQNTQQPTNIFQQGRAQTPREIAKTYITPDNAALVASGALGVGAGVMTGNPVIGTGAMEASNYLYRRLAGKERQYPLSNFVGTEPISKGIPVAEDAQEILENTAFSELFGKIFGKGITKGANAATNFVREKADNTLIGKVRNKALDMFAPNLRSQVGPGSVVGKDVADYGMTVGQHTKGYGGTDVVEDIFSRGTKQEAIERQARIALRKGEELGSQLTGAPITVANFQQLLGDSVADVANRNYSQALSISSASASTVKTIGRLNLESWPNQNSINLLNSVKQTPTQVFDPVTQTYKTQMSNLTGVKQLTTSAPVRYNKVLQEIQDIEDQIAKSHVKPDPNSPIYKVINDIRTAINAKLNTVFGEIPPEELKALGVDFDQLSNQVPFDFEELWATKKSIGDIAFKSETPLPNPVRNILSRIFHAVDDDIEAGMVHWGVDAPKAIENWGKMKSVVNGTYDTFFPAGETGGSSVKSLLVRRRDLSQVNDAVPAVENIVNDHTKLQRAFEAGELDFGGVQYTSSNMRRDLQGYKFMSLFKKAITYGEDGKVSINGAKLLDETKEYLMSREGQKLYNAKQKADIYQFIKNVDKISTPIGGSNYYARMLVLNAGRGSVRFGSGLMLAALGSSGVGISTINAGALLGVGIGLHGLGRLMANPNAARLLIAMAEGGPLGMSTQMAGRFLINALKMEPVTLEMNDGTTVEGRINSKGQFEQSAGLVGEEFKLNRTNQESTRAR